MKNLVLFLMMFFGIMNANVNFKINNMTNFKFFTMLVFIGILTSCFNPNFTRIPTECRSTPVSMTIDGQSTPNMCIVNLTKRTVDGVRVMNTGQSFTTKYYDFLISDKFNSNSRTTNLRFVFEFLNNRELQYTDGEITTIAHQELYKIGATNYGNTFENNRNQSFSNGFYIEYNGVKYYGVDGTFKIKRTNNSQEEYSFNFTGHFFKAPNNWQQSAAINNPFNMIRNNLTPIMPVTFSGTCLVNNL